MHISETSIRTRTERAFGSEQPRVSVAAPSNRIEQTTTWTNPAAAAAMRSTVDLLKLIEEGITRNFADPSRVLGYASDLRSTFDIYAQATDAISADDSKENDSFLPLINKAGANINEASNRFDSTDFATTWPLYRNDVLAQIRTARSISLNVADQLDPRSVFTVQK